MLRLRGNVAHDGTLLRRKFETIASRRHRVLLEILEPRCLLSAADPLGASLAPKPNVLVVNTLADPQTWDTSDKTFSLREAVALAAATPEADLITFSPVLFAAGPTTLFLDGPAFVLEGDIAVQGPSSTLLTLDGQSAGTRSGRIFVVAETATATISGLTLTGGRIGSVPGDPYAYYAGCGGAILDLGNLTVSDSSLSGNQADLHGGAIFAYHPQTTGDITTNLTLLRCRLQNNSAGQEGGGLAVINGTASLVDTALVANQARLGGGIVSFHAVGIQITRSTFTGNAAAFKGGAIASWNSLTVASSIFAANSSVYGGAISAEGSVLDLSDCAFNRNTGSQGGAVYISMGWDDPALITRCSFKENTAGTGGALYANGGQIVMSDSSLTDNSAGAGGAIGTYVSVSSIKLIIESSTLSRNTAGTGGAIFVGSPWISLTVNRSTISRNHASTGGGIYVAYNRELGVGIYLSGTTITRNSASGNGGGLFSAAIHTGGLWTDTTITDNTAGGDGGGIYCWVPCASGVTWTGGSLSRNSAANGGGLYLLTTSAGWDHGGSEWMLTDVAILGNSALGNGGAMAVATQGYAMDHVTPLNFSFVACLLADNSAGGNGGALYSFSGTKSQTLLQLMDTRLFNNIAAGYGGGMYLGNEASAPSGTTTIQLTRSAITRNVAGHCGGGLALDSLCQLLTDPPSTVAGNHAVGEGNDLWWY